jgi:hypothetical protein
MGVLMQWRHALVREGRVVDEPTLCTVEDAIELAPAHREWIERQVREQELRDQVIANRSRPLAAAPGETAPAEPHPATVIADRRTLPALTRSASNFSEIVNSLPDTSAIGQVERLVASAISAAHLAAELDTLAFSIGRPATRELVVSLLHARSRSHSWRYTRMFAAMERRSPAEETLTAHVASASSAQELLQSLRSLGLDERELDETLIDLLYARSRSMRWRVTHPLRRLLGSPRFWRVRRALRRAQPSYASFRNGRARRRLKPQPER